jgi:2-dehydro-3-deoxy-D-arabinonate dehydratase
MHLYKTESGAILHGNNNFYQIPLEWDSLINRDQLHAFLSDFARHNNPMPAEAAADQIANHLLAPIGTQEIWAAGVTYLRSRDARMEESEASGAADCYQRVYEAERPELFFKSLPHRVAAHHEKVNIRKDSTWDVPEPELTLYINGKGVIQAYTIGNDMSSRSIEGENPLYLPQAKMYERSAAIGPCLFVPEIPISPDTIISMEIWRDGVKQFDDRTPLSRMKRSLAELAGWLFRALDFPQGAFLMTGTCVVPGNDFTLQEGDRVNISISGIGTLSNTVAKK